MSCGQLFGLVTLVAMGTTYFKPEFIEEAVAKLGRPIVNGGIRMMEGAGRTGNSVLNKNVEELNIKQVAQKIIHELNEGISGGIQASNIDDHMGDVSRKFGRGLDQMANEADRFTKKVIADGNGNLGEVFKGVAINTLPWIVLSTAILAGIPLSIHYFYKKSVHSIGRPKLAGEVKYVGLYNRITDLGARGMTNVWKCVKPGVQSVVTSAVLGYTASTLVVAVTAARALAHAAARSHFGPNDLDRFSRAGIDLATGVPRVLIAGTECYRSQYYVDDDCIRGNDVVGMFALGCLATGVAVTFAHAARIVKDSLMTVGKKDPKAYFNDEVTQVIKDFTESTTNTKKHGGYFQNLLLYGPGGTGKTMISKIIAKNSGINYVMMSGGDLAQYIKRGEHVTELNKLFEDAKNSFTPTIITIDECESMCRDRDKMDKQELIELLNAFLNHTGVPSKNFLLVLITNRMEDLDEAVLSRMDHKVFIGPPARTQREQIVEEYAKAFFSKKDMEKFFSQEQRLAIADQVEGLTGRAIFKMMNAIHGKKLASKKNVLTQEMVDSTVKHFVEQEQRIEEARAKKAGGISSKPLAEAVRVSTPKAVAPDITVVEIKPEEKPAEPIKSVEVSKPATEQTNATNPSKKKELGPLPPDGALKHAYYK